MHALKITAMALVFSLSVGFSSTSYAQFKIPEWIGVSKPAEFSTPETKAEACKRLAGEMTAKAGALSGNREFHMKNYTQVEQRLRQIASTFKTQGYDTNSLSAYINSYTNLVIEYKASYDQVLGFIKLGTEGVCTPDGQGLRLEIQYAKDSMIGLVRKRQEIRQLYSTKIRQNLIELRAQSSGTAVGEVIK